MKLHSELHSSMEIELLNTFLTVFQIMLELNHIVIHQEWPEAKKCQDQEDLLVHLEQDLHLLLELLTLALLQATPCLVN